MKKVISKKIYDTETAVKVNEHNFNESGVSVNEVLYMKITGEYFLHTTKVSENDTCETIIPASLVDALDWEYGVGPSICNFISSNGQNEHMSEYFPIHCKIILDNLKEYSGPFVNDLIDQWSCREGISEETIKRNWKEMLDESYSDKDLYDCLDKWDRKDYDSMISKGFDMDNISKSLVYAACEVNANVLND